MVIFREPAYVCGCDAIRFVLTFCSPESPRLKSIAAVFGFKVLQTVPVALSKITNPRQNGPCSVVALPSCSRLRKGGEASVVQVSGFNRSMVKFPQSPFQ